MVIGLTGGIASGKVQFRNIKELGAYIVDADIIAKVLYKRTKKHIMK